MVTYAWAEAQTQNERTGAKKPAKHGNGDRARAKSRHAAFSVDGQCTELSLSIADFMIDKVQVRSHGRGLVACKLL
jgi:hypothetical protein